jgi:hypothetical protein
MVAVAAPVVGVLAELAETVAQLETLVLLELRLPLIPELEEEVEEELGQEPPPVVVGELAVPENLQ